MRVYGSAVVRNEADPIEAFVRHNLTLLDGLVVVDHLSLDATYEILQAMVAQRLAVFVARESSATFDEFAFCNRHVRHAFATRDADWVFPLDADESLKAPSRSIGRRTCPPNSPTTSSRRCARRIECVTTGRASTKRRCRALSRRFPTQRSPTAITRSC